MFRENTINIKLSSSNETNLHLEQQDSLLKSDQIDDFLSPFLKSMIKK
jgi:hypothetical protein